MLFNSIEFAIFLPVVFGLYWWLERVGVRSQNLFLIGASYLFYGWWDYRFLALIVVSSTVDFMVGRRLADTDAHGARRGLLLVSLGANLGILGFFKYFGFFVESFAALLGSLGLHASLPALHIILPVGISFYTFQTLSYTIDIYRRHIPATSDPVAFFAFVSFFPQLVAGPIERAESLLPQFLVPRTFDHRKASEGCRRILGGFVKKVVVADTAAVQVNLIFSNYQDLSAPHLLAGAFLFAIQIYCDFSGYSDIAIGTAKLFGFDLMQNFAFPYFSRDIGEFWRRWHISLSTWFRDYVFIPLGGSRGGVGRTIRNIMITFVVSGLWHGANWTFIVWGALNGLYYIPLLKMGLRKGSRTADVAEGRLLPSFRESLQLVATFGLTLVAWVFFRSPTVSDAWRYLEGMVGTQASSVDLFLIPLGTALLFGGVLLALEWLQRSRRHLLDVGHLPYAVRHLCYVAAAIVFVLFGRFEEVQFIYFQF